VLQALHYLFGPIHTLWRNRLTVLAYHRITDPHAPGFDTFKPNVSATPAEFAAQMDFVREHFNVVSSDDLIDWLDGKRSLPPYPALITFDDGYRDNYDHAWPILRERGLPATLFLTTGFIGTTKPFYWDLIAYCFYHTRKTEAELPPLGYLRWNDEASRDRVMKHWLGTLKRLSDAEKQAAVEQLPQRLDVTVKEDTFAGLLLSWDQVREMAVDGFTMGSHTESHPILTRIPIEQARAELEVSKARIEAEIGRTVRAFAYTNGMRSDFNVALQAILPQIGYRVAFTLLRGPATLSEVRNEPMAIRRVSSYMYSLARFKVNLTGIPRLLGPIRDTLELVKQRPLPA
jgi:peptidoglycan/xylan/chitin deacetylase (PgdA/CDA1 family)